MHYTPSDQCHREKKKREEKKKGPQQRQRKQPDTNHSAVDNTDIREEHKRKQAVNRL